MVRSSILTMYDVCCFAVHLGPDVNMGHYRVLLLERGSGRLRYCDDGRKPLVLKDFGAVAGDIWSC